MTDGTKPRRRPRRMKGALMIVAGLMICSAMLRMGQDAGQAWAKGQSDTEATALAAASQTTHCETPPDFQEMLTAFENREARLQKRETALSERMQALRVADEEIERKLARLVAAEEKLAETISIADTAAEDDIGRLVRVYESMKPKQAAALFEEMSPEFAAGFLGRMRPEAAAGVMAGLSAGAAHGISVILAGRNADVPTE